MKTISGLKVDYQDNIPIEVSISDPYRDDIDINSHVKNLLQTNENLIIRYLPQEEFAKISSEKELSQNSNTSTQRDVISIFNEANKKGASDIHITIQKEKAIIEFRIHGSLVTYREVKPNYGLTLISTIYMSMTNAASVSFNKLVEQNARIKESFLEEINLYSARYSHKPTSNGLYCVLRLIPHDKEDSSLDALGISQHDQQRLEKILRKPEGILIFSGPTGQGKSTTLRVLCSQLAKERGRLITIEDPPEGLIPGAIQTPIIADKTNHDSVKKAWETAIHGTLRQDPDVIMIGELQTANSINIAMIAAQTGKLLLSTIHSNNAVGILDRMLKEGVSKEWLADSHIFIGLVGQRLFKVTCPHCGLTINQLNYDQLSDRKKHIISLVDTQKIRFINPKGCKKCSADLPGVIGRTAILEIIAPNEKFMTIWYQQGAHAARQYWIENMGGVTRANALIEKINQGQIDPFVADKLIPIDEDEVDD